MLHKNKTENPPNVECGNAAKIAGKNPPIGSGKSLSKWTRKDTRKKKICKY